MKVDRTRFLLLTTALSAATAVGVMATGCTVTSTDKGGVTNPATEDGGGTDGAADAYYSDGGDGGACLGDDGLAASCAGANASCTIACEHYLLNYKKGVARAITQCIIKLPTCEGVSADVSNCAQSAIARTCADSTATGFCSPIVESCKADGGDAGAGAFDLIECNDVATALNSVGRAAFTTCITEGTPGYCTPDPSFCITSIE